MFNDIEVEHQKPKAWMGIRAQKPLKNINQGISRKSVELRSIFEPPFTPLKDLWENPREGKMKINRPHD